MERMSRWLVSSFRSVKFVVVEDGMGGVVDLAEAEVVTKWMGVSAMEVQFMIDRNSLTSTLR